MGDFIYSLLNSYTVVPVLLVLCLVFFVFFVAYALSKEGRDERGRAVMGTACFYGAVGLFIAMNIFTQFTYTVTSNVVIVTNSIRLVVITFFVPGGGAIVILRKLR